MTEIQYRFKEEAMGLSLKQNIFLAKKMLTETIYNAAYIEGCNVTFPQTQTIIDGAIVNNVSVDDIQTVINLRDAWRYMLSNAEQPLTIEFICKINENVSRNQSLDWGVLRYGEISISGTTFKPALPEQEKLEIFIKELNNLPNPKEKALEYFTFAVKNQLFWDGNKRTSTIVANKILIENGAGILTIGKDIAEEFNSTLQLFYETNDREPLKRCLEKGMQTLEIGEKKDTIIRR